MPYPVLRLETLAASGFQDLKCQHITLSNTQQGKIAPLGIFAPKIERRDFIMNAHKKDTATPTPAERVMTKRIRGTTYIITARFNGNAKRNPAFSLVRLIEREFSKM